MRFAEFQNNRVLAVRSLGHRDQTQEQPPPRRDRRDRGDDRRGRDDDRREPRRPEEPPQNWGVTGFVNNPFAKLVDKDKKS